MSNGHESMDRPTRGVKVMADYSSFALWDQGLTGPGNIDPRSLPLSRDLVARLDAWAARYDATLNRSDPASSGFASPDKEQAFAKEGLTLAFEVKRELGPDWVVTAYDHWTNEVILISDVDT
jgi:hypothetical protein